MIQKIFYADFVKWQSLPHSIFYETVIIINVFLFGWMLLSDLRASDVL